MRSTMTDALERDCQCLNWMVTVGAGTRVFSGHAAGRDTVPPGGGDVETTPKVAVGVVGDSQEAHARSPKVSRVR
jgi:hypothetical protein